MSRIFFYQIYTIHDLGNVFALLPNKTEGTYQRFLQGVFNVVVQQVGTQAVI